MSTLAQTGQAGQLFQSDLRKIGINAKVVSDIFVLVRIVPNDPAAALAGQNATPQQVAEIRAKYGFDRPLIVQFVVYLRQVVEGDFGASIYSGRPVSTDIGQRLPATLELTFAALLLGAGLGVPLGVIAAVRHNGPIDHVLRFFTVGGVAIASFWFAIMMQLVFAMEFDILPLHGRLGTATDVPRFITGFYLVDSLLTARLDIWWDALKHMTLPAVTLSLGSIATITRFTRSGVLEALQVVPRGLRVQPRRRRASRRGGPAPAAVALA